MQYKQLIRKQMLKQKRLHPKLRSCHLADRLKIEASYLSRFFTDSDVHFSDELLFSLLRELEMNHEDIDQILTLKEFERCTHPERKRYLEEKLSLMKLKRIRHEFDRLKKSLVETLEFLSIKEL